MNVVRLLCCSLALAACATPARTLAPTTTPSYRLCADLQFEGMCTPASTTLPPAPPAPIQIDTNLKSPRVLQLSSLG